MRGCTRCTCSDHWPLIRIKKKILYLDQFFLSHAYRENDERFLKVARKIEELASKQLLVTPYSSIHEDETFQWRGYDEHTKEGLMDFIKKSARGHEFKPAYEIEENQIISSFLKFLNKEQATNSIDHADAFNDNIHAWDDYFWIDVGRYIGEIELIRTLKTTATEQLVDIFTEWRKSENSFDEDVLIEQKGSAESYLNSYFDYIKKISSGDFDAFLNAPIISQVVQSMRHCCPKDISEDECLKAIANFFTTDLFRSLPYQKISSQMFACLKDQVKNGAFVNREKAIKKLLGFFSDVKHIATYAPYCDAIFIDQPMFNMVNDKRINLEANFNVKVFSLSNLSDFEEWLDDIEKSITKEHEDDLKLVYP